MASSSERVDLLSEDAQGTVKGFKEEDTWCPPIRFIISFTHTVAAALSTSTVILTHEGKKVGSVTKAPGLGGQFEVMNLILERLDKVSVPQFSGNNDLREHVEDALHEHDPKSLALGTSVASESQMLEQYKTVLTTAAPTLYDLKLAGGLLRGRFLFPNLDSASASDPSYHHLTKLFVTEDKAPTFSIQ